MNNIDREIVKKFNDSQFNVSPVAYHKHNNVDAPAIPFKNIENAPNYFCVAKTTTGTTGVPIFSSTGANFNLTITGIYLISNDGTAGNITITNNGNTVATIAKGTATSGMVGATSLANTAYTAGNSLNVVSSSVGNATVFLTFTV